MKSKILIVDDEENIRFGFEMILTEQGYDVKTASNYESALEVISETEPDLVLSDIILGGHTGIDLLDEIKKRKLICPVVMITGEPNIETSTEAVRLGAFDYISKPIRKDTLLRITSHSLRHKKLLGNKQELEIENAQVRRNMEAIFRSMTDGVITVGTDLKVMEANKAVQDICRFSPKELVGQPIDKLLNPCTKACIASLKKILKTRKAIDEFEIECKHQNKPSQIVRLNGSPLISDDKHVLGAVLVVKDVTRLATLERELNERHQYHRIIGKSRKMQEIYELLENLADTDSTVLVTGKSGTGKELIASAIHHNSPRKEKPFIKVNCSALSENLLESELFGHMKGAFTGAVQTKKGRFEMAHGGTLFLDELGDMSHLIQLKLLRVLQEREFERVGDSTPIKTDVRVIAATNCDLKEKIRLGEFREDLYYRIKVMEVKIPALSERREDIPLLADHFLGIFNTRFKKQIKSLSNEVIDSFMSYHWPGNIRELEHAVEHGFVLCRGNTMLFEHLPLELKEYFKTKKPNPSKKNELTKDDLLEALVKTDWNKSKAARLLGIGRRTIYRKIEEFKIQKRE